MKTLTLFLLAALPATPPPGQYVVAVWDSVCVVSIEKTADTRLEAPVDSGGRPDMRAAKLVGVHATINQKCMRYEIRRTKPGVK